LNIKTTASHTDIYINKKNNEHNGMKFEKMLVYHVIVTFGRNYSVS